MGRKRDILLGSFTIGALAIGSSCVDPEKDVASLAGASSNRQGRADKKNMRWVGHDDLQARSAYQPTIHAQGGKMIAYIGHHTGQMMNPQTGVVEWNGTSILDVTDPRRPVYLKHIPGPVGGTGEAGGAQMARVCDGSVLPNGVPGKVYLLRTLGSSAHQVWDTTDPQNPTLLTTVLEGLTATHKNYWECETGLAYLVAGAGPASARPDGWQGGQHLKIYNLSNPAAPVYVRDYGLPGTNPGSSLPVPPSASLHGPISVPSKNRVYMAWGINRNGVAQILDRSKLLPPPWGTATLVDPARPTDAEMLAPQVGRAEMPPGIGAHTTFPVLGMTLPAFANHLRGANRDILAVISETFAGRCQDDPQIGYLLDITVDSKPWGLSTIMVDDTSGNPPFCTRGARFAAHSSNESFYAPWYGKLIATTWFNAGTRIFDIRDPMHPAEVAHFIPPANANTISSCFPGSTTDCHIDVMTNNAELDDRGLVYAVDRANTGLDILSLSGKAASIVGGTSNNWRDRYGDDDDE